MSYVAECEQCGTIETGDLEDVGDAVDDHDQFHDVQIQRTATDGGSVTVPSRDNSGRHCTLVKHGSGDLPDHITRCTCETHTGVCQDCNFKITIGAEGTEYGHARAGNKGPNCEGDRVDCLHRPTEAVDPSSHWGGHSQDGGRA